MNSKKKKKKDGHPNIGMGGIGRESGVAGINQCRGKDSVCYGLESQ